MAFVRSIVRIISAFTKKLNDDKVSVFCAQTTYYIILSFFPFIMFLLSLLQYLPLSQASLLDMISHAMPDAIADYIIPLVKEVFSGSSGTILSFSILVTLWSASKGFLSIVEGLNSVYSIDENRNYFVLRLISIVYTVIFAVLIILLLAVFVFGNQISIWLVTKIPSINDYTLVIISLRSIVGLCVLVFVFLLLYIFIPNRKTSLLRELPGSVVAAGGWIGFSFLYSFYIDNMSNMSATYGSLTAIVLCMLWLYICIYIAFIGAELNSVLANPKVCLAIKSLFSSRRRKADKLGKKDDSPK